MEYRRVSDVAQVAQVFRAGTPRKMSRPEKLERWAALLEQNLDCRLRPLVQIEFLKRDERLRARADGSPLSIAHDDPILREQGLTGDTVGDAMAFFGLSEGEIHYLLCDCHYHGMMTSATVAERLRGMTRKTSFFSFWFR